MARQRSSKRNEGQSTPGRLRIVAGKWRSRLLNIAEVQGLRPTPERIRETLFNWLAPRIHGARCLDLFAGTGALGFEALSRGAGTAKFIETSRAAAAMLNEASTELGADNADIERRDAFDFLRSGTGERFNLVFLDPPFADDSLRELCRLLEDHQWLAEGAQIYIEQEKTQSPPDLPEGWAIANERIAGNVRYSLLNTTTGQTTE